MKPSPCLALLALLPLGCGGATPAPTDVEAVAIMQRPAEVTVVDLSPAAPPAPKEQKLVKAADGDPGPEQEVTEHGFKGLLNTSARFDLDMFPAPWDMNHGAAGAPFKPLQVKIGAIQATAGLLPEIIQRIVQRNHGRFRLCYENGLRSNPKLAGKVAVRFVINKDGAVSGVSLIKDTTMPDANVSACVTRAFTSLSFSQPNGTGVVIVTSPILFSPAENAAAPATKATPAKPAVAPVAPAILKSP